MAVRLATRVAIEKDSLLSVAHYQLAQAYMNLRQYRSAIDAYKGCLAAMARLHALEESSKFQVVRAAGARLTTRRKREGENAIRN